MVAAGTTLCAADPARPRPLPARTRRLRALREEPGLYRSRTGQMGCEDSRTWLDHARRRQVPDVVHRLQRHEGRLQDARTGHQRRWAHLDALPEEPDLRPELDRGHDGRQAGREILHVRRRLSPRTCLSVRRSAAGRAPSAYLDERHQLDAPRRLKFRNAAGDPEGGIYGTPAAWFEDGHWYLFYEKMDLGVWLARSRICSRGRTCKTTR